MITCFFLFIENTRYVVEQLQCLGILQTCEVLKVGMPTRVTYKELKEVSDPMASTVVTFAWAIKFSVRLDVYCRAGRLITGNRNRQMDIYRHHVFGGRYSGTNGVCMYLCLCVCFFLRFFFS